MTTLGFFSDPHVQYLSQILEEIAHGRLKIPRFQRPLVWDWNQRLELLRSIRRGIPMGAIMVWRTNTSPIRTYEGFGRFRFKSPESQVANQYILDGVQRLTTLFAALFDENAADQIEDAEDDGRVAYFDLVDEDFVALRSEQADPIRHLRLSLVLDSVALLRYQRGLTGAAERALHAADEVAKAFREYKVPVIPIVTDDLSLASETFQRINSSGVPMSEMHMLHALTWSNDFNLIERLEAVRQELGYEDWGQIDEDLLIKIVKAALDCDVYRAGEKEVSLRLRARPAVMSDVSQSLGVASAFFWTQIGIATPDMVPYGLQTLIVAEAFRVNPTPSAEMLNALLRWVWATTYTEYFTGLSGDKVSEEIQRVRLAFETSDASFIEDGRYRVEAVQAKSRFDARTARSKATILRLAEAYGLPSNRREGFELLKAHGRQVAVPLFTRADLKEIPDLYASPGNRFLVQKEEAKTLRAILIDHLNAEPSMLAKHCVDPGPSLFGKSPAELVLRRAQHLHKLEMDRLMWTMHLG